MKYHIVTVTPFLQNCTFIWCEHTAKAAIVDPGGDPERILETIASLGIEPVEILLTHGHIDHVGASRPLADRLGIPLRGPGSEDAFLLEALPQQSALFGFDPIAPFTVDEWLTDGDRVQIGESSLEVIHCPGHTPGHLVYYDRAGALAQVGDVLFRGSIGRTDFPRGNHQQLLESINKRLLTLDDDVQFVPGHGLVSTIGRERRTNPFLI